MYIPKNCIVFCLTVAVVVSTLYGCGQVVESSMKFTIPQFSEFLSLTSNAEKESYIAEGNLDFAEYGEVYIVPFIKETSHKDCSLFAYVYFTDKRKTVVVNAASLSLDEETAVFLQQFDVTETERTELTNTLSKSTIKVDTFPKSETWFKDQTTLLLSMEYTIIDEARTTTCSASYEVKLEGTKALLMPT